MHPRASGTLSVAAIAFSLIATSMISASAAERASFAPHDRAITHAGSAGYPVTADPPVQHPKEKPCVDRLFTPKTPPLTSGQLNVGDFGDYSDHPFNYTPPASCPGPYASIVFRMHFRVTAGVQYDRTGAVWIDGTNVFFGTTSEPGSDASPEWTVERDVTEYASIFAQPSTGQASVYNIVNSQYTGVILGWAELDFYPAPKENPREPAADAVYALSGGPTGGYVSLDSPTDQMTGTFTFPTNVQAAYLDVFLESQGGDEFWYTCFPNDLAQDFDNCGGTAFREGEVSLDGQPAGVVPVYPRIYTGGIDPYLWIPIPGVQTLNFKPYRVDLTPFASQLDDGGMHTVAVSVFNDNNYFNANAALLVYTDHGGTQVTGSLVRNTTKALPTEKVIERVQMIPSGGGHGKILTSGIHDVAVSGYVITSHGRVDTAVRQRIAFVNDQHVDITASKFYQDITQNTTIASQTQTINGGKRTIATRQATWPITVDYHYLVGASSATQHVLIQQKLSENATVQGKKDEASSLLNSVTAADTLTFQGSSFSPSGGKSSQEFKQFGPGNYCWDKTLESKLYTITGEQQRC
jgi:hypothetical protein